MTGDADSNSAASIAGNSSLRGNPANKVFGGKKMGKINTGSGGGFGSRAEKEAHDRDMERRGYGSEDSRTDKGKKAEEAEEK